jgi:acetyl-CoA carboxylase carboxyl transferase subunit alpha
MRLAERFNIPVVTIIDTPGAFPGMHAEERGQAESIAKNITEMSNLTVPVVCVVIGEGGSGGALGIGVGDRILMLSNAIYSVISPEGCAPSYGVMQLMHHRLLRLLNLTAEALLRHEVIDEIIHEPGEGAHTSFKEVAKRLKEAVLQAYQ